MYQEKDTSAMPILHIMCIPGTGEVVLKFFKRNISSVGVNYAGSLQHE